MGSEYEHMFSWEGMSPHVVQVVCRSQGSQTICCLFIIWSCWCSVNWVVNNVKVTHQYVQL